MNTSPRALLGLALLVAAVAGGQQWWVAHQRADVGTAVAALARPGDIHMLSSDSCSICVVARRWFTTHGVIFTECSIERDAADVAFATIFGSVVAQAPRITIEVLPNDDGSLVMPWHCREALSTDA